MQNWTEMQLISTHICKTRDVGNHGNLFGGVMLAWLDEAGAAYAAEFAETGKIVTKHISALDFQRAVRPGQLIKIYGKISHLGRTSLKIEIVFSFCWLYYCHLIKSTSCSSKFFIKTFISI